jgi:hypothetical protein
MTFRKMKAHGLQARLRATGKLLSHCRPDETYKPGSHIDGARLEADRAIQHVLGLRTA